MLKENLDTKDLLETIEKEMEQWAGYYESNSNIINIKIKDVLEIKDEVTTEELQKQVSECKDEEKLDKIAHIIQTGQYAGFEAQVALRTLTWVRNLMIEEENTKEDE